MERTHVSKSSEQIVLYPTGQVYILSESGKPRGFWYEVDGDWQRWCRDEQWNLGSMLHIHSVNLRNCNVLKIRTVEELDKFHLEYGEEAYKGCLPNFSVRGIHWSKVAKQYDGIEIAPYQWDRRLAPSYLWYYGWDCASGVIWQPKDAIVTYLGPCPSLVTD